ncbi:hypothetical protein [Halopiger xanaduensis]|nr:hypothetical protein [Halopiger xanaduensis]
MTGNETTRALERERTGVTGTEDSTDGDTDASRQEGQGRRECDVCGADVPAASYHEHLLKECPGQ